MLLNRLEVIRGFFLLQSTNHELQKMRADTAIDNDETQSESVAALYKKMFAQESAHRN